MTAPTIHRHEIPVDDQWHTLRLHGNIVHVDCRHPRTIELWAWTNGIAHDRVLRVYGTGHQIDLDEGQWVSHVGTALSPPPPVSEYGALVWHLIERHTADCTCPQIDVTGVGEQRNYLPGKPDPGCPIHGKDQP